jgi:HJR/Mrr/RecB family endonuclease
MQNSDQNIISFNNESQPLLEKYQNNVISLQESIKKLERKNQEIANNVIKQENEQNNLHIKLEKLGMEYSERKKYFTEIKKFHSIFSLLVTLLKIIIIDLQKLSGLLNLKIKNFLFEKNKKTLQNNQEKVTQFKNKISFISSQREKGLELYKGKWFSLKEIELKKEAEIGLSDNFRSMSPRRFEFFIAALFEEMGYEIDVTPQTADRGVDVLAKKNGEIVAIQCKKFDEKNPVTNKSIAQLIGSAQYYCATRSIFITTSYYTKNAQEQTKNARIKLWDKVDLHEYVKTYLLNKDITKFHEHIDDLEKKERTTRQNVKEEKYRIAQTKIEQKKAKNRCPYCGGRMQKGRTMCSMCKQERKRERERNRYYDPYDD